jgi:hypothetical protein
MRLTSVLSGCVGIAISSTLVISTSAAAQAANAPLASTPQQRQFEKAAAPAASAAPAPEKQSPEEAQRRKDWERGMHLKRVPKQGCFTAAYPKTDWQEVPCVPAPKLPQVPRRGPPTFVIGNTNDISAQAPSGNIQTAIGSFENITDVTSESGPISNTGPAVNNAYTLQVNTNPFTSSACSGSPNPGCQGWEQFVFWNDGGTTTTSTLFIQYWLLFYNTTCPAGWGQFTFSGGTTIYCVRNASGAATSVPTQAIGNLGNLKLSGSVTSTSDQATLTISGVAHAKSGDNSVAASAGWTQAEFNIFGAGGNSMGGGTASFNPGASMNARTEIIYGGTAAPTCSAVGFTGEKNNLSFGPTAPTATTPGPAVIFEESIAGGALSNCAAAASIGDTHLATFNGLFYDFQASGDFVLAQIDPTFTVQTRQVSGAPQWPNAAVNKAVAARLGKTQVAVCLASTPETNGSGSLFVDGKTTALADGASLEVGGGSVLRQGNVYFMIDETGNSVRAEINSTWINVNVGLGNSSVKVRGLIANPNGNVNQLETSDGVVLNNPFGFEGLYHQYADSWRVPPEKSMLSVCGGRELERGIPKTTFYAKDLEPQVREHAAGVCNAAGVKPGPLFEACTLDVAVIGQDAAAKVFVNAHPPTAVGTIVAPPSPGIPSWLWWVLLLLLLVLVLWFLLRKKKP